MQTKLRKFIIRILKASAWGVIYEPSLPAEFVITNHGKQRLSERVEKKPFPTLCKNAWYKGRDATKYGFNPHLVKEYSERFKSGKIVYKYYRGYVYVFAIHWHKKLGYPQKHLVTVLYWNKSKTAH